MKNINNEPAQKVDDMEVVIKKTKNYEKFRLIRGNRGLNPANLANIIESIQTKNLLQYAPILVNKDGEVVDGQHRLAAAKKLGLEIYYMIVPNANIEDVQLLNANHRAWKPQDYLESYCSMQKKDYVVLKDFMNVYDLPISVSVMLLSKLKRSTWESLTDFRNGRFKVVDMQYARMMGDRLTKFRNHAPRQVVRDRDFIRAFQQVIDKVDFDKLYGKIESSGAQIRRESTPKEYLRQLEDIYNKGNKNITRFWGEKDDAIAA